jgi:hypothetical protein
LFQTNSGDLADSARQVVKHRLKVSIRYCQSTNPSRYPLLHDFALHQFATVGSCTNDTPSTPP